jgi:hypothetical protein
LDLPPVIPPLSRKSTTTFEQFATRAAALVMLLDAADMTSLAVRR